MPNFISLAYEKSSGQVLGFLSRISVEDGSGNAASLLSRGVVVRDVATWEPVVQVNAAALDILPLDVSSTPGVWNKPQSYQIVDGDPTYVSATATATISESEINFKTPGSDEVGVFAQIEGGTLEEPIVHDQKTDELNYKLPLNLAPGHYSYILLVQGFLPKVGTLTVTP